MSRVSSQPSRISALGKIRSRVIRRSVSRSEPAADEPLDEKNIPLCWAASTKDTRGFANLGDSLSAVVVSALTDRPVEHVAFGARRSKLVAVGSIGHAIRHGTAVVWGAGVSIRGGTLAHNAKATRYDVRAVRGPISAQHFRDFDIPVPEVYGDPVWLLPSIVEAPREKTYELGIIPHIRDVDGYDPEAGPRGDSVRYKIDGLDPQTVAVINTWHAPTWQGLLDKLQLILSCKRIISQSFHGLVIADAFGIPCLNFRYQLGRPNGLFSIDLNAACATDPRVWEFYKAGGRQSYPMYTQRRDEPTDWERAIRAVDDAWEPFAYDAKPLVDAFPLPLAYDPLTARAPSLAHVEALRF